MLKTLSTAGLGAVKALDELMDLASQNGFDAIDIPTESTLQAIEKYGTKAVKLAFMEKRLLPGAVGFPVSWSENTSESQFLQSLESSHVILEVMNQIGCSVCTTYLMPGCNGDPEKWRETAADRIRKMDDAANEHGLRFGVEYVAPKHLIAGFAHPFVHTAAEMLELIAQSGSRAGLLLDSLHWFAAEETIQAILSLRAEQIVHVHLNDSANLIAVDNDRLYPGEGIIPLQDFLSAIQQVGYDGCVALEVLTQKPLEDTPNVLAKRAADGFAKVWPKTKS